MKTTHALLLLAALYSTAFAETAGMAPAAGQTAPDFTLPSESGSDVSLKDFRGQWVVLYFYPKDFTGGCTLEAQNFQRDYAQYAPLHAVILGVSEDTAKSHKDFCAKEGLAFKLLADSNGKVAGEYGSTMEHAGTTYAARHTFIVDPKGKIAKVFLSVDPATHSNEVIAALKDLQKSGS